jgi:hypothetical protein
MAKKLDTDFRNPEEEIPYDPREPLPLAERIKNLTVLTKFSVGK